MTSLRFCRTILIALFALSALSVAACSGRPGTSSIPSPLAADALMRSITPNAISPKAVPIPPMLGLDTTRPPMSLRMPQSSIVPLNFTQLPGAATWVAASPDGTFWVLSTQGIPSGDKFIYHYINGSFVNVPGAAIRIAVGPDSTPWVLNAAGGIYHLVNGVFTGIAGGASELSVGGSASAIVVDVISNQAPGPYGAGVYQYSVNTGTWTQLPGAGVTVAASIDPGTYSILNIRPGGFYVTNQFGGIYYDNLGLGFEQLPGGAIRLAPTASGGLFALGDPTNPVQHGIYYNDLSTGVWTQMPGAAISIAASSTNIYAIGAAGGIYVSPIATPTPGPIVITAGGTYSGTWQSLDPNTPAVSINTTAAVTITNCTIMSKSRLIYATVPNAHVTITNCSGYGLDPMVAGKTNGDFLDAYQIGSLDFENNYLQNTAFGVFLYNGPPPNGVTSGPITIKYNKAVNLQGLPSDGKGGRVLTNLPFDGQMNGNHFVQLADMQGLTGAEISWNEVDTAEAATTASIGDDIDIYVSNGSATNPILIHDNFINGGYPANPNATLYYECGITMDGTSADTAQTATSFVRMYNNQIISHAGSAICLTLGHDNQVYSNRVVISGQYPDGTWYVGYAGISVDNPGGNFAQPASVYFNNWAQNNVSGDQFEQPNAQGLFVAPILRNDYYVPNCAGGASGSTSLCTGNVSYMPALITRADETAEIATWQAKLATNGITLGPISGTASAASHKRL